MLKIHIEPTEMFDELKGEFVTTPDVILKLEHSLLSISKWESKFEKPFLHSKKSNEEVLAYIRCMSLTDVFEKYPDLYIPPYALNRINDYISAKMTATWFRKSNEAPRREIVTSELIYSWMIAHHIPFECQKWHLNRLLTLIRVCSEQAKEKPKMTNEQRRALNAQRNAQYKKR